MILSTPSSGISLELKKAVIAAEDLSFFSHSGFDTHELKIAARDAVRGKRVRGASTITQQLAKNLWLSPSRSPFRKIREAILTRQLEILKMRERINSQIKEEMGKNLRVPGTNPFFFNNDGMQGNRLLELLDTMPDLDVYLAHTGHQHVN